MWKFNFAIGTTVVLHEKWYAYNPKQRGLAQFWLIVDNELRRLRVRGTNELPGDLYCLLPIADPDRRLFPKNIVYALEVWVHELYLIEAEPLPVGALLTHHDARIRFAAANKELANG